MFKIKVLCSTAIVDGKRVSRGDIFMYRRNLAEAFKNCFEVVVDDTPAKTIDVPKPNLPAAEKESASAESPSSPAGDSSLSAGASDEDDDEESKPKRTKKSKK